MHIEEGLKLGFKDVLIRPKRSVLKSRSDVTLERHFTFKHSGHKWSGIPIIAANMDTVGDFFDRKSASFIQVVDGRSQTLYREQWADFVAQVDQETLCHIMVSTGTSSADFETLKKIQALSSDLKFICIDVANGYSEHFISFVKKVRDTYPDKVICAGNVVTGEIVEELILSGADIVKVGIGSGSVCTTRIKTGVGYPQLSAIIECADAAHGLGGRIVSDGGCTVSGDVAKAFGGGADFVMLGGMLAGHDECEGQIIEEENGEKSMLYYGMSSESAMKRHAGGVAEYRAAEGKTVRLPLRGSVNNTVKDVLGGLRSACTYVGASYLKELTKRTTFIRVTEQANHVFGG